MKSFFELIRRQRIIFSKNYFYITLFFIILLASLRVPIWAAFHGNIIGHNWDWTFPAISFLAHRIDFLSIYAWNNSGSGYSTYLASSQLIPNLIVSGLSYLFPPQYIPVILIALFCSVSFFFFKKFLDTLTGEIQPEHYISSLLYAFSPFLFNEIIGGSWYMWLSFAFTPVFLFCFFSYLTTKKFYLGILSALSLTIVFASTQNFVMLILFTILYFFMVEFKRIKEFLFGALKVGALFFLLGLYWLLPVIGSLGDLSKIVSSNTAIDKFASVALNTQNFFDIISLAGYLDRNMYLYSFPGIVRVVFILSAITLFTIIVVKSIKNQKLAKLLVIFLLFVFFVKGGNGPLGNVTIWIFRHVNVLALYRSPQHLMFVVALIMPIMLALALSKVGSSRIKVFILLIVLFMLSGWWLYGDFGQYQLTARSRDHIDYYKLSDDLKNVYTKNEKTVLNGRYLFLPSVYSPFYLDNGSQHQAQGGQPEYMYLKNPTNFSDFAAGFAFADEVDKYFCGIENFDLTKYLSLFNYKTIVSRSDILPFSTKCGIYNLWNDSSVQSLLSNNDTITKTAINGVYDLKNEYFVPIVSVGKSVFISDRKVDDLIDVVSDKTYQISDIVYLKDQNVGKDAGLQKASQSKIDTRATIEFKEINPSKYKIKIHQANSDLLPLVLSQNFHSGWKVYIDPSATSTNPNQNISGKTWFNENEDQLSIQELASLVKNGSVTDLGSANQLKFISKNFSNSIQNENLSDGHIYDTWFQKPLLTENDHLVVNGYANGWLIDPTNLCNRQKVCRRNSDGTYDIDLIIAFKNQDNLNLGLIVSSIAFSTSIVAMIYLYIKKKRKEETKKF